MEFRAPYGEQAPVFSNKLSYKSFVLGWGDPVASLSVLSQIENGEFKDMVVMPNKYGKAFPTRQGFFDVFDLADPNGECNFVIGFGRAKPYADLNPQERNFFERSLEEQRIIEKYFSVAPYSFIPRQWLAYGTGLQGFETTVFIRDRFEIIKTLPQIAPQNFDTYPDLGNQFTAFRKVIGEMRRREGCMVDIANSSNLGIDQGGNLKFFDLNYLISDAKKDYSGALNLDWYPAIMNLWCMADMTDGISYRTAKKRRGKSLGKELKQDLIDSAIDRYFVRR